MIENDALSVSAGLERCPHLGLHDDPRTALAYPSMWNYCYRAKQPGSVNLLHQGEVCLSTAFIHCPVYAAKQQISLPPHLHGSPQTNKTRSALRKNLVRSLLFLLLLAAIITVVMMQRNSALRGKKDGEILSLASPGIADSQAVPATPVHELTLIPAGSMGLMDSASLTVPAATALQGTSTPTGICGHVLDVPFGKEVKFVLHRVISGENLTMYAEQYDTTVNAILNINYRLPSPVWENWIVVIPLDNNNVSNLPPFETYQEMGSVPTLNELARGLKADPQAFQRYNAFEEGCSSYSGWLLIPREAETPLQ